VLLRRYADADRDAVRNLHVAAFGRDVEARLHDELLDEGDVVPELSLVAIAGDELVGHVVSSRASVDAHAVVGLGPIGVLPDRQRAGVGLALMHASLAAADALGYPLVGLLGSPDYYGRFGFVSAASVGVEPPDPAWGDFFQVRTLAAYTADVSGRFRYAPAFDRL
jgi:putative acetyltransferase